MNRLVVIFSAAILSAAPVLAQPAAQFAPDSLTRALWHFNETSGIAVHDTAAGLDGTAMGTTIIPGRFGNARSFNGTGDYVYVPSNAAFNFDTSGFSVDVWFRTTQQNGIIIRRGLAPEPGFMISLSYGHVVGMIGTREDAPLPNGLLSDISDSGYADNNWHIATMVRNRELRKLFLYVDGVPACAPSDDNFPIPLDSDRPLTIGRWESDVYPAFFAGSVDEVRILRFRGTLPPLGISVQPKVLDFGWVPVHASDTLFLHIQNTGNRDSLRILSLESDNPLFGTPAVPIVIPPGVNRAVPVWYSPVTGKAVGDTTVLRITSNDSASPGIRVLVYGFGYASNAPTSPFIADSLTRALWHFDEGSGQIVRDTAAGNDGSAFGTAIVRGIFGNARSFNGTSDYVIVPSSTMFDFDTSSFRVDVWFKSLQTSGVILRRGLAPEPGFMIALFPNGHVVGMIGTRSDGYWPDELLSDTSVAPYNDNAWHMATMVRDRNARRLLLYVDGVLACVPAVDNFLLPLNSTRPLTIGRWESDVYPGYFAGSVDEVRISSSRLARWPVKIQVQPGKLDFGWTRVNASDTLALLVTNAGYRDSLRVQSVTSTNPRFNVPAGQIAIGQGSSGTLAVVYTPATSQADTGTITVASNDPSSPAIHVAVTGRGFAPLENPVIMSITRVSGSYTQARILWLRSRYDTAGTANGVTQYSVWHRTTATGITSRADTRDQGRPDTAFSPGTVWEFIQTVPAIGVDFYAYVMELPPTYYLQNPWEVYVVVAQTRNLGSYISPPDSVAGLRITGAAGSAAARKPDELTLNQNYPNPFNPSTTIRYGLPAKSTVSLIVYNSLGQAVATLVSGEQEAGYYEVRFEGTNLASGIYFSRLKAGTSMRTNKILLLR